MSAQNCPSDDSSAATRMQEPINLVIAGQSILAGDAGDAPALYEMNRGVANLGHATTHVELSRIERIPKSPSPTEGDMYAAEEEEEVAAAAADPGTKIRRRHIFDLVHPTSKSGGASSRTTENAASVPSFYMRPRTKTTHAGTYGLLRKSGLSVAGAEWRVLPAQMQTQHGEPTYKDKKATPLFQVKKDGSGSGYEWTDAEGRTLAVEERSGGGKNKGEEDGEEVYRLVMSRAMERDLLDALVAMWCCRVWEEAAEGQPEVYTGMQKGTYPFTLFPSSPRLRV